MASNNDYMPWLEAPQWDWSEEGITDQHGLHRFMDRYSHSHRMQRPKIYDNILTAIGDSPLVKLHKIPERFGVECNVYVKPELFNSGGSIKDRVALKMIETAEAQRRLKPGMTIIEPTSGNTGIGLALVAAVKGYKCIIVMPDNMSKEKADLMHALGVKIVRTPAVPYADPDSHVNLAFRMQKQIPGSIILNQYLNCANPLTHYEGTGNEILDALNENVDMIVAGVGTGGTITGVAKKCKNVNPNCIIVGADPIGQPDEKNYHLEVEGIHPKDGMPVVLDTSFIDEWIKVSDKDVFTTARQMIQEEGILCGGSSGCAIWAAMQAAKKLKKRQNCVVILPDSIRNYMTKFLTDDWMVEKKFMELPVANCPGLAQNGVCQDKENGVDKDQQNEVIGRGREYVPKRPKRLEVILDGIGWTPMVKLNRIPKEMGLECDIYVKCDYLNPSGSTNDRLALAMFNSIEKSGNLKPGWTLIAPTCGSTAISLAMISTIRSYKLISVLPESTSPEINITLHALGAQTVHATPESAQKVAHRLHQEIKDSVVLDEHRNQEDSYESLVKEILKTMDGSLDMFVAQTEVASGMNPKIKDCTSVGVTPTGPVLADPLTKAHVASVTLIQIQTNDKDAFEMARKLIKDEGILCGGLSGANVWAACQMAKGLPRETKLVVLLPDSVTNYMSSFLNDDWMKKRGYVV